MNQRDIVLVQFPFSHLRDQKLRPALIISSFDLGQDVIVMGITSHELRDSFVEESLENKDLDSGELPQKSFIRCGKIATIEKSLVIKIVGKISVKKWKEVKEKMAKIIA